MHGCYIGLVYCILRGSVSLGKKESLVSFSNKTGGGHAPREGRFTGLSAAQPFRTGELLSLPGVVEFGSRGAECRRSDASRIRHGETGRLAAPWGLACQYAESAVDTSRLGVVDCASNGEIVHDET